MSLYAPQARARPAEFSAGLPRHRGLARRAAGHWAQKKSSVLRVISRTIPDQACDDDPDFDVMIDITIDCACGLPTRIEGRGTAAEADSEEGQEAAPLTAALQRPGGRMGGLLSAVHRGQKRRWPARHHDGWKYG